MTHTTPEGYVLTAYRNSLRIDFGLSIDKNGERLFDSRTCLPHEHYGFKIAPRFDTWEAADHASREGDETAFEPWSDSDWVECLEEQASDLLDLYLDEPG